MASVLVVDDEPDARYLLRHALEAVGHEVTEAANGAVAIAAITLSVPDLVVTDMMMPVMNGMQLIESLRADIRFAAIPILCVSGNCDLADGADVVLDKYGDMSALIPLVANLVSKGRGAR